MSYFETGGLYDQNSRVWFSSPPRSERFWGPPSPLSNGYPELPWG